MLNFFSIWYSHCLLQYIVQESKKKVKRLYQLITGRDWHQVNTLELSGVGEERLRAGFQDLITQLHQLTALEDKINQHLLSNTS